MASPTPSSSTTTTNNSSDDEQRFPDLGLDPSDPLNLLLNDNQNSDMDDNTSPPSWSDLSALWPPEPQDRKLQQQQQQPQFDMDFATFPMDMDMENMGLQTTGIDPSALQLGYSAAEDPFLSNDMLSPFDAFQTLFTNNNGRRLSVTSSSSSSGASLSPIMDHHQQQLSPSPEPMYNNSNMIDNNRIPPANNPPHAAPLDPAAALAQRVSQMAGVTVAVPAQYSFQGPTLSSLIIPHANQLPPHGAVPSSATPSSRASSAESTPPPSTPSDANAIVGKPKTSHTTIERRYRTNLNARIQSLRMAVPALRVVEDKESTSSRKVKVTVPVGQVLIGKIRKPSGEEEEFIDVVDDRGFVDGVKIARKASKANVLGKAVEYIRVLKKRESRLKREQDGLKSLVNGLVGGPALLREWEREWKLNFGGDERDEVEGEDSLDDLGSDDDDDDEDDEGRKRKKPKVAPAPKKETVRKPPAPPPQPIMGPDGTLIVPEKRKRGRPRKVQPGQTPTPMPMPTFDMPAFQAQQHQQQQQQPQQMVAPVAATPAPQQYLLAAFALVSFFNSPFTSSPTNHSEHHTHSGTVLTSTTTEITSWSFHDIVQVFHLIVSAAVFLSIALPWIPNRISLPSPPVVSRSLASALLPENRGKVDEAAEIYAALGSQDIGLVGAVRRMVTGKGPKRDVGFHRQGLEQRAWVRLGEICVAQGQNHSTWSRLKIYWHMRAHLAWLNCGASELSTAALLLRPLSRSMAKSIWELARERKAAVQVRAHERLALESMDVDEAYSRLQKMTESEKKRWAPIQAIARALVKENIKSHLEVLFVKSVLPNDEDELREVGTGEGNEERQRRSTIEAARSLGGDIGRLGEMLHRISGPDDVSEEDLEALDDDDIKTLVSVILHYRRIFPTSTLLTETSRSAGVSILLSPPPSPTRKDGGKWHYALRCALGSPLFDHGDMPASLEEARDRVIDMLVEVEKTNKAVAAL